MIKRRLPLTPAITELGNRTEHGTCPSPLGAQRQGGTRAPSASGVCSGLTCGGLLPGPFLVPAFPSPCGAVPTHPCEGLCSRQKGPGPSRPPGRDCQASVALSAACPAPHQSRGVGRETPTEQRRREERGGQPGVPRAGLLDSRLLAPGNFTRDLGFGDRGTRAEVRRAEASAGSAKGQGWPRPRRPCLPRVALGGEPGNVVVFDARPGAESDSHVRPSEIHSLSAYCASGGVLGTGQGTRRTAPTLYR